MPLQSVPSTRADDRPRPEKLPTECRRITSRHLTTALPTLMERVDDTLFELADKSANNTQQAYYFEVMRQIRLERHTMEN